VVQGVLRLRGDLPVLVGRHYACVRGGYGRGVVELFPLSARLDRARDKHGVQAGFFSTEIAMTPAGQFVTVDYVNEICDMRLQSRHPDGVPDRLALAISGLLAEAARASGNRSS